MPWLAPVRRRLVLVAAAAAVLAVVAGVVAATRGQKSTQPPASQATPGPVLLVPGYGGSTAALNSLATSLRAHGKDVELVALPDDARGDLATQARSLGKAASQLLARTKAPSVDVVGYSAGGVVARLWVRDYGGRSRARRVITLGSPHHGTDIAALADSTLPGACPTACQQLASRSQLLAALNAGDETPPGPTFVSIWTTHDDVVIPPDSASLDGALDLTVQSICPDDEVKHGGLPTDRAVQSMVLTELRAGPPIPLGGAQCETFSS